MSDADGLDNHHVEARGFREQDRLARAPGNAAQRRAGGRRADEAARIARELRHARLVAQQRAAAALGGGIHREHGEFVAALDHRQAEGLDEGRFADAGRAGYAEPDGALGGTLADTLQEPLRRLAVIRPGRFHQRDRAGERATVAAAQRGGQSGHIDGALPHPPSLTRAAARVEENASARRTRRFR